MKTEINGQIKWFSREKEYGFITAPGRGDFYFHAIDVTGAEIPEKGDAVCFVAGLGNTNKPAATKVTIVSKHSRSQNCEKSYYGKATYEYHIDEKKLTREEGFFGGFGIGLFVGYFALNGGWLINIFSGIVCAFLFGWIGKHQEKNLIFKGQEITSTCLRCGGIAQVTARDKGKIGFQCPLCKSFWKARDNFQ